VKFFAYGPSKCFQTMLLFAASLFGITREFRAGWGMALKVFRERSRTALHFSGSMVPCIIGEKLFRHSLGISPPDA
jgi:hypothetical protein